MKSDIVILVLTVLGIGMLGYGLYLIYPPIMWIVLGVFSIRLAVEGIEQKETK